MLQHLIIKFSLYYLLSGLLREVKKQRKISNFQLKNWSRSLTRGGRLQEVPIIVI